ncbi:MAG: hypothetical protein J0I12_33560 [Candidatus Eremiobacteraeota bacterium]|nr:hypothetical protein [Candidatus Eremiobacteraeota bacterium]
MRLLPSLNWIAFALLLAGCGSESPPSISAAPPTLDGRARLLQMAPASVPAIDALGVDALLVYADVAAFSNANPALTGTIAQAVDGVEGTVRDFGAARLAALLASLSPDNGQSLCSSVAGNLDSATPSGADRCRDSLAVVGLSPQNGGRNPEVQARLSPDLNSLAKFHSLRLLWPAGVPPQQRQALKQLRDSLTYPVEGTPLQKALKVADMNRYLNGTFDPRVSGFAAVSSDVASLTTPAQMIEGLRLDYPGGFQNEVQVAILQYHQLSSFTMSTPYSPANGGTRTDDYPFSGTGFTATTQANAIPEWTLPAGGVPLQSGDTLTLLQADGTRVLQATFQGGHWLSPNGTPLTRRQGRTTVEQWTVYQGHRLFVTSQDASYRYVLSDAAVLDLEQVGLGEWRGRIPLDGL